MDKSALLKRLMKEQTPEVVHSSGYVDKNKASFGSTSTESFEQRRKIDANRKIVKKYSDSSVVRGVRNGNYDAKKYQPGAATNSRFDRGSAIREGQGTRNVTKTGGMTSRPNPGMRRNPGIFR